MLYARIKEMMSKRSYRELLTIPTFEERYKYLRLTGQVGIATFGFDRYLNQNLYRSIEWKQLRNKIIVRDEGNDLAFAGQPCFGRAVVHHINPITEEMIVSGDPSIFDLDNLVLCSLQTHNAIHYGDPTQLRLDYVERRPNDTCPWR